MNIEWIRTVDRLPTEEKDYLIHCGTIQTAYWYEGKWWTTFGAGSYNRCCDSGENGLGGAVAWAELDPITASFDAAMAKTELKMLPIEETWANNRDSFVELSKAEFDELVRSGKFSKGPLQARHSQFMQEFGPYSPGTWVFGELEAASKRVCTKI